MPARQVKNEYVTYAELVSDIEGGVLKIPDFQRDFDWGIERTLRLLDSLAKGYPIGSFLFWDTQEPYGSVRNIGGLALPDTPEGRDVTYVLDGQQRITSLYAAAKGAQIEGRAYRVYCDLSTDPSDGEFFSCHAGDPSRCVELSELIGPDQHIAYDRLAEEARPCFNRVRDAFRLSHWPVIRVKHQPLDVVCEMFERLNRGGMELDTFDIMVAKTWTPDFSLRERCDEVARALENKGFGRAADTTILQAVAAQLVGSIKEREILRIKREEIISAWDSATEAVRHAVDFVRQTLGVPGIRLLPYPAVLVVLSFFFRKRGLVAPDRRQAERLMQYYWRAGFQERYGSNPSSTVPEDFRLVEDVAASRPAEVPVQWPVTWEEVRDAQLRLGSAFCRTLLSLLAHEGPVDLRNGSRVVLDNQYLAQANSRHYHHVFPKAWLARVGLSEAANSLANIMLVPAQANLRIGAKPPSSYMRDFQRKAGPSWSRWLQRHLITAAGAKALMEDDFGAFVSARAKAMARKANKAQGLSNQEVRRLITEWEDEE
ncbi:MAG: DUF262 domain-containing protein [Armatimonadetes bacterium]|nr:DUF262 domain-containing protein [Armatimonadota bacterium]